jgi:NAD(P)-dependent dehydrogenase (short-subunit alcohol dehydrogenase family)
MLDKTILVLGAQGVLGGFAAAALKAEGFRVLRAGRRAEIADDFRVVDLDQPETLIAALTGVDLVVSGVEDPQVRAEVEILRRGGALLSMASLPAEAVRRLQLEALEGAIGSVVLNSGLTGVGGLVVKELLEAHPDADSIELCYFVSLSGSAGLAGVRYVHRLLTASLRVHTAMRRFTPPLGLKVCFDVSEGDEIWVSPSLSAGRDVRTFLAVAEAPVSGLLLVLNWLGLLSRLPQAVLTTRIRMKPRPATLSREPMRARLAVYRKGVLLEALGIDAEGAYSSTVAATVQFARALFALGNGPRVGVHAVEDIFQRSDHRASFEADRLFVRPLEAGSGFRRRSRGPPDAAKDVTAARA